MRIFAVLLILAGPLAAQTDTAARSLEQCLQLRDAVFEQALSHGVTDADAAGVTDVQPPTPRACTAQAMEVCEMAHERSVCWGRVSGLIQDHRLDIVAQLPGEISHDTLDVVERYERLYSRASTPLCARGTENEACLIAESIAVGAAYNAWRVAREIGAMPLVGYGPVDLEALQ